MLKNSRTFIIEWGDCDPAQIVFYPRYFAMFDHSTTTLISSATKLTKYQLFKKYPAIGYPMVDTQAKFYSPNRYGDTVTIESEFTKFGTSSFDITHKIMKDGKLTVEGFEKRVWVGPDPADPSKIKSMPIPDDLVKLFKAA
jgi:4-hydroxybenzoyl-CoA thioesterase